MPREPRYVKVTQEQYFAAAYACLAENGSESVTISRLCGRLGVTSGSFYHYFGSMDGFVDALLGHWEAERTQRVADMAVARENRAQGIDLMREMAIQLPHEAESAIRAWSRSDERVAHVVRRVDATRHTALRVLIEDLGIPTDTAARLATMGLGLLVGMQQMQRPVDRDQLRGVFDEFQHTIFRHRPEAQRPRSASPSSSTR